jgi:hypothetical protein
LFTIVGVVCLGLLNSVGNSFLHELVVLCEDEVFWDGGDERQELT